MKKIRSWPLGWPRFLLALLSCALVATAIAEASPISFGAEFDFGSRYVWRGMALSDGAVVQPTAWVSAFGFTFSGWGNMGLQDAQGRGKFDEVDLTLSRAFTIDDLGLTIAGQSYVPLNQDSASATGELSVKFSYPAGSVNLTTTHSVDVVAYRPSYYGELAIDYDQDLSSRFSIESSIGLGWGSVKFNDSYWGVSRSALDLAFGEFAFSYYPLSTFYVRPHIGVSSLLDAGLRSQTSSPTLVFGGLALGMEF